MAPTHILHTALTGRASATDVHRCGNRGVAKLPNSNKAGASADTRCQSAGLDAARLGVDGTTARRMRRAVVSEWLTV